MTPATILCSALSLADVAGAPANTAAAPHGGSVALEIVADVELDEEDAVRVQLSTRLTRQLRRRDVEIEPQSTLRLEVTLRWRDNARTTYAVDVVLAREGEILARDHRDCELCGTAELFEAVSFGVAVVTGDLLAARVPTPSPPPPPIPVRPEAVEVDEPRPRPARLGPLGWAGVGVGSAGLVALTTGAALWARGTSTRVDPQDPTLLETRDYRRPGIAFVATGASLVAGGLVLIAVDASRRRRRRWAVAPRLDHRSAGLVVGGRL